MKYQTINHSCKTTLCDGFVLFASISYITSCSPLSNLVLPWHLGPDNLIAVQQTQRVKRLLELTHGIDSISAQLVREVIALDEADAVFARGGAFELERALDHVVHEVLGLLVLCFTVVEDDG